jgi:hypothetical protein
MAKGGRTRSTTTKSPRSSRVNRDVGPQSKGPRLQRLRAALLLINATKHYPEKMVYVAVEFQGDVCEVAAGTDGTEEYHEEDKNYDPKVSFTMNSEQVLNSLVAFCDCWIAKALSKNVWFGFYTPCLAAKERVTERTIELGIDWPDGEVLNFLAQRQFDEPKLIEAAKRAVIGEYTRQSESHDAAANDEGRPLGGLEILKGWDDGQWRDFFGQIEWKFGEDDASTIEGTIIDSIQASPAYNEQLAGREQQIVALLLDLIDKRQAFADPTQRVVHVSETLLVFKNVETNSVRLPDPAWQMWENLPKPTDLRNLADKVSAVCPSADANALVRWSRKAAQSLLEQRELSDDKQVLALKYQVFDACEERMAALQGSTATPNLDASQLYSVLDDLIGTAKARFADCSRQYNYTLKSAASIESMVYELLESCFLSFERRPQS